MKAKNKLKINAKYRKNAEGGCKEKSVETPNGPGSWLQSTVRFEQHTQSLSLSLSLSLSESTTSTRVNSKRVSSPGVSERQGSGLRRKKKTLV